METFSKESWALTSLIMVDELQSWWFLIVIVVIPYDKTNAGSSPALTTKGVSRKSYQE